MPSFWNTPSSSSTSAAHDFPDQFSPTSSNASPFRKRQLKNSQILEKQEEANPKQE